MAKPICLKKIVTASSSSPKARHRNPPTHKYLSQSPPPPPPPPPSQELDIRTHLQRTRELDSEELLEKFESSHWLPARRCFCRQLCYTYSMLWLRKNYTLNIDGRENMKLIYGTTVAKKKGRVGKEDKGVMTWKRKLQELMI